MAAIVAAEAQRNDVADIWPGVASDLVIDPARSLRDPRDSDRLEGSKDWLQS